MFSKSLMIMGSVFLTLWTLPASAQPKPPIDQQNPSTVDPKPCAPDERLTQDPQTQRPITTGRGENLSEMRSRNEGVLRPPNLDPDIKLPTPDVGNTPRYPATGQPRRQPQRTPKMIFASKETC